MAQQGTVLQFPNQLIFYGGIYFAPTTNHVGLEYIGVGGEISTPLKAIDLEAVVSNLLSVKRTKQFLKSFIQVQV